MEEIQTIIATITWPGAIAMCGWFAYKLYPLYLNKSKGNGGSATTGQYKDARIDELMDFKAVQEGNHNTDLARLLERDQAHDEVHSKMWEAIRKQGEDLAYIKGRMNGNHKQ